MLWTLKILVYYFHNDLSSYCVPGVCAGCWGYRAMNEATDIYGSASHGMDTKLTASHPFSCLNSTTVLWGRYYQLHFKIKKLLFQKFDWLGQGHRSKWQGGSEFTPSLADPTPHVPHRSDWLYRNTYGYSLCPLYFKQGFSTPATHSNSLGSFYFILLFYSGELLKSIFAWASPQTN